MKAYMIYTNEYVICYALAKTKGKAKSLVMKNKLTGVEYCDFIGLKAVRCKTLDTYTEEFGRYCYLDLDSDLELLKKLNLAKYDGDVTKYDNGYVYYNEPQLRR